MFRLKTVILIVVVLILYSIAGYYNYKSIIDTINTDRMGERSDELDSLVVAVQRLEEEGNEDKTDVFISYFYDRNKIPERFSFIYDGNLVKLPYRHPPYEYTVKDNIDPIREHGDLLDAVLLNDEGVITVSQKSIRVPDTYVNVFYRFRWLSVDNDTKRYLLINGGKLEKANSFAKFIKYGNMTVVQVLCGIYFIILVIVQIGVLYGTSRNYKKSDYPSNNDIEKPSDVDPV